MHLPFAKYEGLGNDFVLVELGSRGRRAHGGAGDPHVRPPPGNRRGRRADCRHQRRPTQHEGDRRRRLGARDVRQRLRCVALDLRRTGWIAAERFDVDTDSGLHACHVLELGVHGRVEVAMRAATLVPAEVPVVADAKVVDEQFSVMGRTMSVTAVSMGNPHAVTFDDAGTARPALAEALQRHERFPNHANVGFARAAGRSRSSCTCLERGSGWTHACGTGACAAAVAAIETGRAGATPDRGPAARWTAADRRRRRG